MATAAAKTTTKKRVRKPNGRDKKLNVYQRMLCVMNAVEYVQKDGKAGGGLQYSYVSHDAVVGAVRDEMVRFGIIMIPVANEVKQDGNRTEVLATYRIINVDDPSDFVDVQSVGYGVDRQDKGPGKALSYAKKYALLQSFLMATGDDPERDNIDHSAYANIDDVRAIYKEMVSSNPGLSGPEHKKMWQDALDAIGAGDPRAVLEERLEDLRSYAKPSPKANGKKSQADKLTEIIQKRNP